MSVLHLFEIYHNVNLRVLDLLLQHSQQLSISISLLIFLILFHIFPFYFNILGQAIFTSRSNSELSLSFLDRVFCGVSFGIFVGRYCRLRDAAVLRPILVFLSRIMCMQQLLFQLAWAIGGFVVLSSFAGVVLSGIGSPCIGYRKNME